MTLYELRRWVKMGEGDKLEFKRKANHPNKIAREIVAFSNTRGGLLLVGVDDDGTIYGSKYAREDAFSIQSYLEKYCAPQPVLSTLFVPVNARRMVLVITVEEGPEKPYTLLPHTEKGPKLSYVRVRDMSVAASREMRIILKEDRRKQGVKIRYGEFERKLLQQLEHMPRITLEETRDLLRTSRKNASYTLIRLVRAGLLHIHPTEKGDYFTLAEEAFLG